jgi:hypothetical protein
MKKLVIAALAASAAFIATPAAAQTVTGTITMTGSVAAKCFVMPGSGSTFSDSVNLGELAQADGTLRSSASLATDFDAGVDDFQVLCTTANPEVTVTANPLASATLAPSGYDNSIDYVARAQFSLVSGGPTTVSDPTTAGSTGPTPLGGRLNGTGTNVHITADTFSATGVLVAATDYSGTIVVLIAPGT